MPDDVLATLVCVGCALTVGVPDAIVAAVVRAVQGRRP
jgi:hypothetical protein